MFFTLHTKIIETTRHCLFMSNLSEATDLLWVFTMGAGGNVVYSIKQENQKNHLYTICMSYAHAEFEF